MQETALPQCNLWGWKRSIDMRKSRQYPLALMATVNGSGTTIQHTNVISLLMDRVTRVWTSESQCIDWILY